MDGGVGYSLSLPTDMQVTQRGLEGRGSGWDREELVHCRQLLARYVYLTGTCMAPTETVSSGVENVYSYT